MATKATENSVKKAAKKMPKKKTRLTPERARRLVELLRVGNYQKTAAAAVGIHETTLANWMRWGQDKVDEKGNVVEEAKEPYRTFAREVQQAIAEGEGRMVEDIANNENWKAKAWLLSRRFPDRWGVKTKTEVATPLTAQTHDGSAPTPSIVLVTTGAAEPEPWEFGDDTHA